MNFRSQNKLSKETISNHHESKMGYPFCIHDAKWRLDGSTVLHVDKLVILNKEVRKNFRVAICRYAEETSASMTKYMFDLFASYLKSTEDHKVSVQNLTRYRNDLNENSDYKLGCLKGFLLAWYEWGLKGVNKEVSFYLKEQAFKRNKRGGAVQNACPFSGPFTHNELASIIGWASNSFTNKVIDLKQYTYFMMLALTGRRPVQIRSLRYEDLIVREEPSGNDYVINCPRAKQYRAAFREEFNPLPINEDLYLLLHNQRLQSVKLVESILEKPLPTNVKKNIPIFLDEIRVHELKSIDELVSVLNGPPDYLHMTQRSAVKIIQDISVKNTAYSERTGDIIHLTAYRFRYTKGTNLSRRGIRGVALAVALDHSTTQSIGVYVENTEEVASQIDEIMSPILAPLAQAFSGTLIKTERESLRANDPNSRIKSSCSNTVGSCGTHALCSSGYRACYTCSNFQPWLEAPHENVLNEIIEERKRQKKAGVSKYVIQSTDRLLLAVQQVVQLCSTDKQSKE